MRTAATAILTVTGLILYAMWSSQSMLAATRVTEDLAELFKLAQVVVEADVLETKPVGLGREGVPMTHSLVRIVRVIKGELTADTAITVEYLGATGDSTATIVPGQAVLVPGKRVVLMLSKFKQITEWRVLAGDAGQIDLGGENQATARRTCGAAFNYYIADPKSLTGYTQKNATELNRTTLDSLLEAIASTGRPVIGATAPAAEQAARPEPAAAQQQASNSSSAVSAAPVAPATTTASSIVLMTFVSVALMLAALVVGHRSLLALKELKRSKA